jgi:two-component system, OmpR family, sensor kinase
MVVTIAALAAIALVVADFAGAALLRSYLVGRLDAQLSGQARGLSRVAQVPGQNPAFPNRLRSGTPFGTESRIYVFTADGTRVYTSSGSGSGEPNLGGFASLKARADGNAFTVSGTDGNWRVRVTSIAAGRDYAVHALSMRDVEATEDGLLLIDAAVTALVLLLIAVAAASVVRIGLRPLTRMEDIATEIAGGDLSRRVSDADPHTESGRLGMALNMMLVRIERALADRSASERRLRRFLADASHELRTPLTSIQGFAELYRRGGAPPGPALDEAMGRIEAEVGRMHLLVNDLLLLARLDEERPLERHPVDLLAVAADAVRDAHVRVPTRFVRLAGLVDHADTFEPVTVLGDEPRIRQVVTNLVANALQHTPDDCAVAVRVGSGPAGGSAAADPVAAVGADLPADRPVAIVEVVDEGPGVGTADATHVFERLYRADPSRARHSGGAGLGLAIVAAIVQAHGGRVELFTAPGEGARFRVLLPAQDRVDEEPDDWMAGADPATAGTSA